MEAKRRVSGAHKKLTKVLDWQMIGIGICALAALRFLARDLFRAIHAIFLRLRECLKNKKKAGDAECQVNESDLKTTP
jgi:hypothetical protein